MTLKKLRWPSNLCQNFFLAGGRKNKCFCSRKRNLKMEGFQKSKYFYSNIKLVILDLRDQKDTSMCRKSQLYPNFAERSEFSHEEFLAYRWFRARILHNDLTERCDGVWQ